MDGSKAMDITQFPPEIQKMIIEICVKAKMRAMSKDKQEQEKKKVFSR